MDNKQSPKQPPKNQAEIIKRKTSVSKKRTYSNPSIPDFTPNYDRVCVLTGASGLLGTAFIKRFALKYRIVAVHNEHDLAPPQKVVNPFWATFPYENPPADSMRADISDAATVDRLCYDIIEKYGKVDLLINAACHRNWQHLVADNALDDAEKSFAVNVLAPMRMAISLARRFWRLQSHEQNTARNRNIINISSTAGSYVYPDSGQAIYSSTKASLNFASHHMASEFFSMGVRVNNIAPNTFPGIVPTGKVLDAIEYFDQSNDTGVLKLIDDTDPDHTLCPSCGFHLGV